MRYIMAKSFLFSLFFCFFLVSANSQIPGDLGPVKSEQINDEQLMQLVRKAQQSGLSESEILAELRKRGLPESEMLVLSSRIRALMGPDINNNTLSVPVAGPVQRSYKPDASAGAAQQNTSPIFGSELFSNADPLFVPNLKIATPRTYVIGPDDELQLDIYGNNISNQSLVVSPEGIVNVKYAGPVNVSGLSIEQAAGVITSRLIKFYPSLSNGSTKLQLTLGSMRSIQVMVIGAVRKPGTVTLPSIATLFNALYASGGPSDNGSFRMIELIRNNKVIAVADLYDFILRGDKSSNVSLRDNDVIRVPFAKVQVNLQGALNRTGIFEIKPDEYLQQALDLAGGFQSNAFQGRIAGTRYTDTERKVIDIGKENFATFQLKNGDALNVETVAGRFENRVIIRGAVMKPGAYSLEPGMDIRGLLAKSQGLAEGAFVGRATLVRLNDDQSNEFVDIDLQKHLSGEQSIQLKKEDSIHVFFTRELRNDRVVTLNGAVRNSGEYAYEDSLTLQGLILKAGGFAENALVTKIEIGRRKKNVDQNQQNAPIADIIEVKLDKDLQKIGEDIFLQPYDQVSVRRDPGIVPQKNVTVSGQVLLPGSYTMESNADLLSILIKRCGGLLPAADINAVKLVRLNRGVEGSEVKRVAKANLRSDSTVVDQSAINVLNKDNVEITINIKKVMESPGSLNDITLEEGDELVVPRVNYVVTVSGGVQKPISVQYDPKLNVRKYIDLSGGYSVRAKRRWTFIVHPNGNSYRVKHIVGLFRKYPKVTPGSTVFVPVKEEKLENGFDPARSGIFVSALSAIMTGLILLFR